jgi:putative Mg2+ transporter-C (MgtC) family protein
MEAIFRGEELLFLANLGLCLAAGLLIGAEREARGKPAGISTHCFVIGGAMLFTFLSLRIDPSEPARVAAQIVTGVGFLGAGIILHRGASKVANLTTAASIWFSAGIGMAIGFERHAIAVVAILYSVLALRLPHVPRAEAPPPQAEPPQKDDAG